MKRPKVLAADLDGTTIYDEFPDKGRDIDGVKSLFEALRELGWKIAIWTVRNEDKDVASHLKKLGVPFDYVNENPHGPKTGSRKIYADVYLDDKAINFDGDTKGLLEKIVNFKPWHARR